MWTHGAPAFSIIVSSAVHGNTYSSSSRGLPWYMATTPSGIVVRVRSSRSLRYPTFPGVSWIRVHRIAAAAVRWNRIQLTPGNGGYLKDLEDRTRTTIPERVVAMYHWSPRGGHQYVLPWTADETLNQGR